MSEQDRRALLLLQGRVLALEQKFEELEKEIQTLKDCKGMATPLYIAGESYRGKNV